MDDESVTYLEVWLIHTDCFWHSVELLIYVFDIESDNPEKDFDHFAGVLEAMEENSPDARIFVLVHKMDLVAEEERELILDDRRRLIEESCRGVGVQHFQCFGTSIWDETLYKAWSEIVTNLIPNIGVLERHLSDFCGICDADEVVLFERATFLVISHAQAQEGKIHAVEETGRQKIFHEDKEGDEEETTDAAVLESNEDGFEDVQTSPSPPSAVSPTADPPASPGGNATLSTIPSNQNAMKGVGRQIAHSPTPQFDAHRFEKVSQLYSRLVTTNDRRVLNVVLPTRYQTLLSSSN